MSGRPRYDEATSYRLREPRLQWMFFLLLKVWFLMREPIRTAELLLPVFYETCINRAFWALCRWQNCELEWLILGPILLYDLHIYIPRRKPWVELKLLRAGHRRKGSTRRERRKESMLLVNKVAIVAEVYSAVCQLHVSCLLYTSPSPRD